MSSTRQQDQLTDCSCEPLMNALTMLCEPAAASARAWALLDFGGAGHAEGCGPGNGAVVRSLASDCNGRKERRSSRISLLYSSSLGVPSRRSHHSVLRWDNVSAEIPRSLWRAALFSSSNCSVFKAPLCLISPNAESVSSLVAKVMGSKRTARYVSWFCHYDTLDRLVSSSLFSASRGWMSLNIFFKISNFSIFADLHVEKNVFFGGDKSGKMKPQKKSGKKTRPRVQT